MKRRSSATIERTSWERVDSAGPSDTPAASPPAQAHAGASAGRVGGLLGLVAPPNPAANAPFAERERARRGRLAGALLLVLTLIELGALVQFVFVDDDHPAMVMTLAVALAATIAAAALNRFGRTTAAGLLLVALANLPLAAIPATSFGGKFDVVDLGALYLAAGSVLVAASVLAPWSVFAVAAVNCALVAGLILGMSHTAAFDQLLASNNAQQAFAGPLLMQAIVALVAYSWARSVLVALRRADRAEEIAALEWRELERTRELEQGVRELLATHVQLANGDFQARVQPIRNPLLWQIGSSLNMLVARFARLAQVDFLLRRTEQEAHALAENIRVARVGRAPLWPAPSGTPLDEVIGALTDETPGAAPPVPPAVDRRPEGYPRSPWPFA
ncbi:MAG TPA: hypothetical protein VFN78_11380 [Ktedonobacterales bacterium]|nr:hypothetical protein [Ktedonobacterales bacterium]